MLEQLIMMGQVSLAGALGALIGWQREKAHKPAGLRTHILIAMGAALFTAISVNVAGDTTMRIAAGVVAGIGFLGAGAIVHRSHAIEGLTTAASIWVVAAIGMACGVGLYLVAIAVAVVAFLILLLNRPQA
jgi:putative Mg2+ transporter-C (MgtC) family protein